MPSIFDALIQQESGGRPGIAGPKTKYGQAIGLTQLLPSTAEEMARKIGVPFNPQMLADKSPQGAAYQRQLGEAYYNEGLQRTGNERDALRYYHGGPNRAMWGPKTNQYADSVMARAGGTPMIKPRKPQAKPAVPAPEQPMQDEPIGVLGAQFNPASVAAPQAALGEAPAHLKKGGIFGSGLSIGEALVYGLNGYMAGRGMDAGKQNLQMLDDADKMQFDRDKFNQELEAKRQAALAAAQADAHKPYRMQNNNGDAVEIDPATGQARVLYVDPTPKTQYQTSTDPTSGQISVTPVGTALRPNEQHLRHLMENPGDAAAFDAKFGRGMAQYYLNQAGGR